MNTRYAELAGMARFVRMGRIVACAGMVAGMLQSNDAAAEQATIPNFEAGDVVSFIGDSITVARRWHRYIHEYHVTRFPDRRVTFINAGISGDTSDGVLRRLERDVLVPNPTVAFFLLGMNDVWRGAYSVTETNADALAEREQALVGFRTNMTRLSERLRANGVRRLIYCSPTPYDETAITRNTNTLIGVNAGLGQCSEILNELANQFDGDFVDIHGPMTALNLKMQQEDPGATIVGWDRIHPGVEGQMALTYLFLSAQDVPALVSSIALDAATQKVLESRNAEVSALAVTGDAIAFTALAGALPWPVEAEARKALSLFPFEERLNQELLRVDGLTPGDYRLTIDESVIGTFPAEELARGINLAFREETPQYRQAQEVQALLEARRTSEMQLRVLASNEHFRFRNLGVDLEDFEAVKARLLEILALPNEEADPEAEPKEAARRRNVREAYIVNKPRSPEIRAELAQMLDRAYEAAQPQPHRYTLSRKPEQGGMALR